ncbi:DEAD/DEAH box helicase [Deinococcus sp. KNUC1210]|uniref:DEAD/DEAH box helicase n=1 Tax=Deinococcus sp. KNUC1210 TaxID=2917691 RepID=UPI001EF1522A|nr:DEAD/DEAH box helicase [Deinococcus sp. KNUC1210]ULH16521.1 DEAD/DEAH box helicase [Deinococcus sp. KNUC1210]
MTDSTPASASSAAQSLSTFQDMQLPSMLNAAITRLGYTVPTEIQLLSLPPARKGQDVLGTAATGSGKTVAFLLPLIEKLLSSRATPRRSRALVLAPTRELAAQIEEVALELCKSTPLRVTSIFGGVGQSPQAAALRAGTEIVIATPGRLLDHIGQGNAQFGGLEVLVLDEADRMLDLGFLPDIRRILKVLPSQRQTLLFSATMPDDILKLARDFQHNPVRVGVKHGGKPASRITELAYAVSSEMKVDLVAGLLAAPDVDQALVFTRTKHRANRVAEKLEKAGISAQRIHGNRSQTARTEALEGFKSGKYRVLVATDIAARGIDVPALGHVINFDVPVSAEDYVHRAGRTARAGLSGTAITLFSRDEEDGLRSIERFTGKQIERATLAGFDYSAKPSEGLEIPLRDRLAAHRAQRNGGGGQRGGSQGHARPASAQQGQGRGGQGSGGQPRQQASGQGGQARPADNARFSTVAPAPGEGRSGGNRGGGPRRGGGGRR